MADSDSESEPATPPRKQGRTEVIKTGRKTKFNAMWPKKYPWLVRGSDQEHARCTDCRKEFSISKQGERDVIRHAEGKKHIENSKQNRSNVKITDTFMNKEGIMKDKVNPAFV